MAKVTIDISEYDSLRESEKSYKTRVAKLEDELAKCNDSTRCIIKTVVPNMFVDLKKIKSQTIATSTNLRTQRGEVHISDVVDVCIDHINTEIANNQQVKAGTQYVNFDDIVNRVEVDIAAQYEKQIRIKEDALDAQLQKYNKTVDELYTELQLHFQDKEEKSKKLHAKAIDKFKEEQERYLKTIKDLNQNIRDYRDLIEVLEKPWYKKLFKRNKK